MRAWWIIALMLGGCEPKPVDEVAEVTDADGDGYGPSVDCDDTSGSIFPGAVDTCNGLDDDCDGIVDEGFGAIVGYADMDGDGAGDESAPVTGCELPAGAVETAGDCLDSDASVHPGAEDVCNGVDDDCDGTIDTGAISVGVYLDIDGDGFGDPDSYALTCDPPADTVDVAGDCDDADPDVHPDAMESCNDTDDDCDGEVDEEAIDMGVWYLDRDADGYGDDMLSVSACSAPAGYNGSGGDCADLDASVFPSAPEVCNGGDDDCDGAADEHAIDAGAWYADADGDGIGAIASPADCAAEGDVALTGDCDDTDSRRAPGLSEVPYDGVDQDCDGADVVDVDGDSWVGVEAGGEDCDDTDATVAPSATELPYDGVDQDCDGADLTDVDGDHFDALEAGGSDCDDDDETISPVATDVPNDGVDQDCSGADSIDADGDGFAEDEDCDDSDPTAWPGASELADGVDNDCNGAVDDVPLRVLSPAGGESFAQGDVLGIAWEGGATAQVVIEVRRSGLTTALLDTYATNDGAYDESLGSVEWPVGGDYQVCLTTTDGAENGCSGVFAVVASDLLLSVGCGGDHDTLQGAVDAAPDGATIPICAGEFSGATNILGRDLTLTGAGEDRTFLTTTTGAVLRIREASDIRLSGVTIHDVTCSGTSYCSVYIRDSDVSLTDVVVEDISSTYGPGIVVLSSDVTLDRVTVQRTTSAGVFGAALSFQEATASLRDCTIVDNVATTDEGAGIQVSDSAVDIEDSTIDRNSSADYGGGLYARWFSTVSVTGGSISDNTASNGAAVYVGGWTSVTLTGVAVTGNAATEGRGGAGMVRAEGGGEDTSVLRIVGVDLGSGASENTPLDFDVDDDFTDESGVTTLTCSLATGSCY